MEVIPTIWGSVETAPPPESMSLSDAERAVILGAAKRHGHFIQNPPHLPGMVYDKARIDLHQRGLIERGQLTPKGRWLGRKLLGNL